MNQHLVQNVFSSIAKAGLGLLERRTGKPSTSKLISLCEDLLSEKGEASGIALALEVHETYQALNDDEKLAFFCHLEAHMSPDPERVQRALDDYKLEPNPQHLESLILASEPNRLELIRRMNMSPQGVDALVSMRIDLLKFVRENKELIIVDNDFRNLFASWFNRGFLNLRRIDWKTPAHILEKLIAYESVHAITNWDDLRRRLARDRRCYAFYHPALGEDEPLIFVEVALVDKLSDNVQALLNLDDSIGDPHKVNTAIFYSINNCQPGLKGISLGNFLIKQVVADLKSELPKLKTFSTLSPVPGFVNWIKTAAYSEEDTPVRQMAMQVNEQLDQFEHDFQQQSSNALEVPLKKLCAYYLASVKSRHGHVLNPVARFHLGNGAILERINWLGDTSVKGIKESAGLMVNYLYDIRYIESNHEAFVKHGDVISSNQVKSLLK